jgi:hypothetical protein
MTENQQNEVNRKHHINSRKRRATMTNEQRNKVNRKRHEAYDGRKAESTLKYPNITARRLLNCDTCNAREYNNIEKFVHTTTHS